MPKKLLLSIIAALLIVPVFFQLSAYGVSANEPMTAPVTFFNLVGKVTYKQLGRLAHNTDRITPAADVKIKVRGFFDKSKKYEVMTDASGNYMLQVPTGMYSVEVDDNSSDKTHFFTPPFSFEKIKEGKTSNADFQGLIFK